MRLAPVISATLVSFALCSTALAQVSSGGTTSGGGSVGGSASTAGSGSISGGSGASSSGSIGGSPTLRGTTTTPAAPSTTEGSASTAGTLNSGGVTSVNPGPTTSNRLPITGAQQSTDPTGDTSAIQSGTIRGNEAISGDRQDGSISGTTAGGAAGSGNVGTAATGTGQTGTSGLGGNDASTSAAAAGSTGGTLWDGDINQAFYLDGSTATLRTGEEIRSNFQHLSAVQQASVRSRCSIVTGATSGSLLANPEAVGKPAKTPTGAGGEDLSGAERAAVDEVCESIDGM